MAEGRPFVLVLKAYYPHKSTQLYHTHELCALAIGDKAEGLLFNTRWGTGMTSFQLRQTHWGYGLTGGTGTRNLTMTVINISSWGTIISTPFSGFSSIVDKNRTSATRPWNS